LTRTQLKILSMPHITLKIGFKEVLDKVRERSLFLGREEGLLMVEGQQSCYPILILPRREGTLLRLDKGVHFLDLAEAHLIIHKLAQDVGGEIIHSTLDPRAQVRPLPSSFATPRGWIERGGLPGVLGKVERVEVEIGFGNGEFLERLVTPGKGVVGIEISNWAIKRALNRLKDKGPHIILKAPGGWAIKWLFPPNSIDALYILFPFPWPKRPSRRLVQEGFLRLVATRLKRGGRVVLATDHQDYAQQIKELFGASPHFKEDQPPEEINTKYLRKWLAQGLTIYRMAFINMEPAPGKDHQMPSLQYPVEVEGVDPPKVMEAFQPWNRLLEGGFFKVERVYLNLQEGSLLFRTTFQAPDLSLHRQFLLWKEGVLDLVATWGETIPPPLARAMEEMGRWLSTLSSTF